MTGSPAQPSLASSGSSDPGEGLAELLTRSARGDEAAFAALYDATAARVHGLVLRVIRDPAQAEEVTQEVFLEIWRQAARFDATRGSATAWIFTIAHRKAVDRVRAAEASTRRDGEYHDRSGEVEHDSTAEHVNSKLEAQRVRKAMNTLTEQQREAIALSYFGGYTHKEVASMLDLPLGTAKTRIRDGLIRLRDTLGVAT